MKENHRIKKTDSGRDRRRYMRHPVHFPILVSEVSPSCRDGAFKDSHPVSSDVSQGGLCFLWETELPQDAVVQVTIPVKNRRFEMEARVVYSRKNPATGLFHTGLSFEDEHNVFRLKLAEEILRIEQYRRKMAHREKRDVSEEEAAEEWIQKHAEKYGRLFSR